MQAPVDSHARDCVRGHLVTALEGRVTPGEPVKLTIRTGEGVIILRECRLFDSSGANLLASVNAQAVIAVNDIFRDALLLDLDPGPGERVTLSLADGYELDGTGLSWSPHARPGVHLNLVPQEMHARECGCVVTDSGFAASPCEAHQPRRGPDGEVAYEQVDGGTYNADSGQCQDCGEVVNMVGFFVFAPCACVRD